MAILSTMQQMSDSYGADPSTVQSLSIVGNYVRTALQQKRSTDGNQEAQAVVNQYSGTIPIPNRSQPLPLKNSRSGCCPADGVECRYDSEMLPI